MKREDLFLSGFKAMLPITTGVIPFGAVMGTVCADAQMSLLNTVAMNVIVFSGAAQLAAVDLMTKHAASTVVIVTGLIINLRFLLYSAALSSVVQRSPFLVKFFCAYTVTDQGYAVMTAHQDQFKNNFEAVRFYIGATVCMMMSWHGSVVAGYIFGNFAPSSLALDFAVPLSFVALVIPTLKNKKYILVTAFSSIVSLVLHSMPYKMGLILTALLAICLAAFLTRKKEVL